MTQRVRLKLQKLLVIIVTWQFIGCLIACYDYFVVRSDLLAGFSAGFRFGEHLALSLFAALAGALMGGSFLVFYVNEKYRDQPYGLTIMAVVLSFLVVIPTIAVLLALIAAPLQTGRSLSHPLTMQVFKSYLLNPIHIKNMIVWSGVVALTQIMLQFNTKFGEGSMWKMIWGKYQTPKEEERIFMFVDLNNSTGIAEQLGDERYHQLLKDYFADITNPIIDNKGEIYQYVGDEVVITWKMDAGRQQSGCLKCFFSMKEDIEKRSGYYLHKYQLVPSFKAGMHCGKVIAGEVGIVKRDITFSGDVLNTTSRIQGKCKEFGVSLISSSELLAVMDLPPGYNTRVLGAIRLRGKEREVELVAVAEASI